MRPDFVSEQNTPALWKLSREGVTFRNHHAVYPSATMVNGTALVTGAYPGKNGIIANHVYRPDIDPQHAVDVEISAVVKKGDELSGGKYISVPTIPELVQRAGGRTVIAAAKTVGLLLDRHVAGRFSKPSEPASPLAEGERMKVRGSRSVTLFAGKSLPSDALAPITAALGPFPSGHLQQDAWIMKALTDLLWKDGMPGLSILWLGEPDLTQHESAPGAPAALGAIKSADKNLASVLSALDQRHARETTDVFVVSDHGFSTIERAIDFPAELGKAGFDATTAFKETPKRGQVMVVGNGGTILFYVIDHDRDVAARLVEWLQRSDFAGVIFAREKFEGTFSLETVRVNTADAPDVMVALRWNSKPNRFNVPGQIVTDNARGPGEASHATLSEYDVHNTLVAAGPDFRENLTTSLPSSNVDIAPTVLRILGLQPAQKLDGRVLVEAMEEKAERIEALSKTIQATHKFSSGEWQQHLRVSLVGETVYIDEGNGSFTASP